MTTCDTCGDIDVRYYRSVDGTVIHRAECTRRGKNSMEWHYAARVLHNDHRRVLGEAEAIPWLRACRYCMTEVTR